MRLACVLLSLMIVGVAARAAATSCLPYDPPWQDTYASPLHSHLDPPEVLLPLDARPWEMVLCDSNAPTATCELFDAANAEDDPSGPVTIEDVGGEFCLSDGEALGSTSPYFIRHYNLPTTLLPGHRYHIHCRDPGPYLGGSTPPFVVRDNDEPAASPQPLGLLGARYSRGDDGGCCPGNGDVIELQVEDTDPAYLREGGHIEAVYPSGQHLVFVQGTDGMFLLPGVTEGVIALTPVSASGLRGETVKLDAGDLDGDTACAVAGRPDAAPWLLVPFAWMFMRHRRRQRPRS